VYRFPESSAPIPIEHGEFVIAPIRVDVAVNTSIVNNDEVVMLQLVAYTFPVAGSNVIPVYVSPPGGAANVPIDVSAPVAASTVISVFVSRIT
jgi:hypothetical protein